MVARPLTLNNPDQQNRAQVPSALLRARVALAVQLKREHYGESGDRDPHPHQLQGEDINYIMLITVYTMVFTCPCLWALIRFCRDWAARRRMVVLPDRKPKKKPDIAVPKDKVVQRARVQNLHGVGDGKKKTSKSPKRKSPPIKNA